MFLARAFLVSAVIACSVIAGPIDVSLCGKTKGCLRYPDNCKADNCTQIVTWRVSPNDASMVRLEMYTSTTIGNKSLDYIAFGLSHNSSTIMTNTSVIVCPFNHSTEAVWPYLSHNADYYNSPLAVGWRDGLTPVQVTKATNYIFCVVDKAIQPTDDQNGMVFPLNQQYFPVMAAGPTNTTTGLAMRHFFVDEGDSNATLTDFGSGAGIDISGCNVTKGCLVNPPGCTSLQNCDQIITWQAMSDADYVRFEFGFSRKFQYLAFGLSVGDDQGSIMTNTSVLACAWNSSTSMLQIFNAHNVLNQTSQRYANVITDQPMLGLRPILTTSTNLNNICVVDRAVMPDPSLQGIIFPLNQPWYPVWASGLTMNGKLTYHDKNKNKETFKVVVTGPYWN